MQISEQNNFQKYFFKNVNIIFPPTWSWSRCWATWLASACSHFIPTSQGEEPGPSIYLSEMKTALLKVAQGAELTEFFCMSDRPFKELVLGQGLTLQ